MLIVFFSLKIFISYFALSAPYKKIFLLVDIINLLCLTKNNIK